MSVRTQDGKTLTAAAVGLHVRFKEKGSRERLSQSSQAEGILRFEALRYEGVISFIENIKYHLSLDRKKQSCTPL